MWTLRGSCSSLMTTPVSTLPKASKMDGNSQNQVLGHLKSSGFKHKIQIKVITSRETERTTSIATRQTEPGMINSSHFGLNTTMAWLGFNSNILTTIIYCPLQFLKSLMHSLSSQCSTKTGSSSGTRQWKTTLRGVTMKVRSLKKLFKVAKPRSIKAKIHLTLTSWKQIKLNLQMDRNLMFGRSPAL